MKKFSEQSGLSTIFFRTMEILFCRYKQYGPVKIYGGVDHRNREGTFMIKCRKLMADFESMDVRRYRLFAKRIRKILGSAAYTRFWDFPRSLELNYDDVFKTTPLDFSALLVCETTRGIWGQPFRIHFTGAEVHGFLATVLRNSFKVSSAFWKAV
jgi:hypothetical protein